MLARSALCRLAAEVPKQATHDLPKLASLVQTARAGAGASLPIRTASRLTQLQIRTYATETVKKAVKAKAAAGESVKKTTTAKKPAAKKATKKAAPKKTKKKKAAAPKKKTLGRPRKSLTDSEKLNESITKLRKLALRAPVAHRPLSAFNVYIADNVKKSGSANVALSTAATTFKDITPAEREKLNHLAAERNEARAAEYKAWVESHTVDEIRIANNARRLLRKKIAERASLAGKTTNARRPANTENINDDRRVKRPQSSYSFFFAERSLSSDFQGIVVSERAKLIAEEWKALSASEKQRFHDQAAAEKQRYARETSPA